MIGIAALERAVSSTVTTHTDIHTHARRTVNHVARRQAAVWWSSCTVVPGRAAEPTGCVVALLQTQEFRRLRLVRLGTVSRSRKASPDAAA